VVLNADSPVTATVTLDTAAPCWQPGGGEKTPYAVFRLPEAKEPYLLGVTSVPIGQGLFPPRVFVLDTDGKTLRERPRSTFMFQGASLYSGLRVQPGERYALIVAETTSVGQNIAQTVGSVSAQVFSTGLVTFMTYTGNETVRGLTYAYNGTLNVRAEPLPKVTVGP
jgi:hypothetical protein